MHRLFKPVKTPFNVFALLTFLSASSTASAQVALEGYFIARDHCPALLSIKKNTNPAQLFTTPNYAYDLIGKNKANATHYQIRIGNPAETRWVALHCGEQVVPVSQPSSPEAPTQPTHPKSEKYVLAVSWQAAFCETRPDKPECLSQTSERYDASHFALHGLWPQPRSKVYCGVPANMVSIDKDSRWADLPPLVLSEETRAKLNITMPGTQSYLHRHEWLKHGTCYDRSEQTYYEDSLRLMRALNKSPVRELFANNVGNRLTAERIQEAFDKAFGKKAGRKIKISCAKDGKRRLIKEITIGLAGDLSQSALHTAIGRAENTNNVGCDQGIVDPDGFQ